MWNCFSRVLLVFGALWLDRGSPVYRADFSPPFPPFRQLLIHNVRLVRGMLLLEPTSVVIKGNQVEEMEAEAEKDLETKWRDKLG